MRTATFLTTALMLTLAAGPASRADDGDTRLLRFPDLHGDSVVFCYAGDLWKAPTAGGDAVRLTAHPGQELFPRFSPDGSMIAFTGQYDGDEQVYVMPAAGGVPRRLTWYPARGPLPPRWGYDNQVYDWTADGRAVLFRSMRAAYGLTDTRLYLVDVDGGLPTALPLPRSGGADLSPDGRKVVYSPLVRDFRTWKRYQGGWAQELYVFDLDSRELTRITDHPRADRDPMWLEDRIVFASDRDGVMNLYVAAPDGSRVEQLTRSRPWDIRWPSDDGVSRIVYERNGALEIYDLAAGQSRTLRIRVPDDGLARRPSRIPVAGDIEGFALSPGGERALIVARGDLFTVPVEKGAVRNLTRSSGAHDKEARWSPDGRRVAFVSDRSGEEEIYLVDQDGRGKPERLTKDGDVMRYTPEWSPDGERLAFSDKGGRLYVLEIEGRRKTLVADEARGQVQDYVWSPRGGHLAFSLSDPSGFNSIYIWSVADATTRRVTGEMWNEFSPAWDPEGNYLFFLGDREFAPQIGSVEWNFVVDRETALYALALRADVPHPFPPESDEVEIDGDEDTGDGDGSEDRDDDAGEETDREGPLVIDFDGLAGRVARVPVEADNYGGLAAVKGHLLVVRTGPFYYGRQADVRPALQIFDMKERKTETLAEGVTGYALSRDGSKVLVRSLEGFQLMDATPKGKDGAKAVATRGLEVDRVPAEEWTQIFDEVWRRYRDFFYVENMHGYDWEGLRDRYRPLLAHVAHRSDLNYLIGEMIAELNVGHAYISGGDYEVPERPSVALPGAEIELDPQVGRYRLARILPGQNEEERYRSPLTEVGVEAREGDYILAIDGEELTAGDNPYRLLVHKADRPVTLTLGETPDRAEAREVTFRPVTGEADLRYLDWITANRERVDGMTGGRVGYLHIPDMGSDGIREFIKHFYGQIRKEGLIVDVRGNGGGNVSQMVIERLRRELLGTRFSRNSDTPGTYPAVVFHGPMVCLLNEDSASDGDIFPHMFRQAGLGPLIGKRSWGGVVGITNRGTLIDGGTVFVPEFGTNAVDGSWVIEGEGVAPDIEVENDPVSLLAGRDPQLERGVEEVLRLMKESPMALPERPADPVKTP